MSNPHRKYFKLVKTEESSNQSEIAIKSLPGNVKLEIPLTSQNLHVKHESLDKKPLKLEIPSPLKFDGTVHEDLPPLDVKDVLAVQQNQDSKSVDFVESIGTLISWANHNPWEDEMSTDSDYNPFEESSVDFLISNR
ncbi:hypothetical protein L1987_81462 [Smallanthus sonchifolius]|uniref:Uncharacterized protein n=1 Tax=Smallanthus sonchifolius TaxID=185202 RepID=A0ACB8YS47_9ASTR|nr:hypothetical protein L1987_81462 [Smallanthus sonchifolius]